MKSRTLAHQEKKPYSPPVLISAGQRRAPNNKAARADSHVIRSLK